MLTQGEADALVAEPKWFGSTTVITLALGVDREYALRCADPQETFLLNFRRGRLALHHRHMMRARKIVVLRRLCVGKPHTNPDGEHFPGTHLHIFREGFDHRFAVSVDPGEFTDLSDVSTSVVDFCRHCAVTDLPYGRVTLV